MKIVNKIKNITYCFLLGALSIGTTSCEKDDDIVADVVVEGAVFQFDMRVVYTVSKMTDIAAVDMTFIKGEEEIVVKNIRLSGDENSVSSEGVALAQGEYIIKGYVAYNAASSKIMECEFDWDDSEAHFQVTDDVTLVVIPISVRVVEMQSYVANALLGLCLEVFGEDESTWPWDRNENVGEWDYLEFEYDDYGSIAYLAGINFDSNHFEGWNKMTTVPYGTISQLITMSTLTFIDLPNLVALPSDLDNLLSLEAIALINTGLTELPENFEKVKAAAVTIVGAPMEIFPAELSEMPRLNALTIRMTNITEINTPLVGLELVDLKLSENKITTIGEGVLSADMKIVNLDLSGNDLSSLPAVIKDIKSLRGLNISNCMFTSIPDVVKQSVGLKTLWVGGELFATISSADITSLTDLEYLSLDGSNLASMPVLTHSNLSGLVLSNCGLDLMPDFSMLPSLRMFDLSHNMFNTIAELDFSANEFLTKIVLSDNESLVSLPATSWGVKAFTNSATSYLYFLDVSSCANLTWSPNSSWNAYEMTNEMYDPEVDSDVDYDVTPHTGYIGRVGINKKDSPNVTIQ